MNHLPRIAAPSRRMLVRCRLGSGRSSSSYSNTGSGGLIGVRRFGASNNIGNVRMISIQQPNNGGQFGRSLSSSRHYCVYSRFESIHLRRFGSHATQQHQEDSDDEELANNDDQSVDEELILAEVEESNERFIGHIQVKRVNEHQWGVFTSRPYTKGSTVISSTLLPTKYNTNNINNPSSKSCSHSIQIDWNTHILMEVPARFLNHCCDPNIGVEAERGLNENGSYDFVALRDIDINEEVRFDYETTEFEIGAFETCHCGAECCRGTIAGYRYNSDIILAKYGGGKNLAGYLLRDHIE